MAEDACASAEDDAGADVGVLAEADLAAEDGSVLDDAGAGDAGLRGDDDVAADHAVVGDVDEVVDLRALADAGLAERAAVDGGVGADLDVVGDDERALLGEGEVLAGGGVAGVAEAGCAEHCAGLDDDAVANGGSSVDRDVGEDGAVVAEGDAFAEDGVGADAGAAAVCTLAALAARTAAVGWMSGAVTARGWLRPDARKRAASAKA